MTRRMACLVCLPLILAGCATVSYPFPLRDPMWADHDMSPFAQQPSEIYTAPRWDTIDNTVFRQLAELWLWERGSEAINVNSLDEVPDSSWFENRIGRNPLTPERLAQGACSSSDDPPHPWTVIRAKTSGSSPGLVVRAADGLTYVFKIDFFGQPERATAADAIGTRLYWAAGYFTPCNRVVAFEADDLVLSSEPYHGHPPPSAEDVQGILEQAGRMPDGTFRGSLSEYIEGTPLGGWRFDGLRDDDPNDVVPHERRRETRGMWVLAAWTNHIDARAENNMDSWIEVGEGQGYLRHYVLDVGDSFGIAYPDSDLLSESFGVSHYVDLPHIGEDFLTLGIIDRPYFDAPRGPAGDVLGWFDVERLDPEAWRVGYPNPAFERATERDRAWMARILGRFTEEHLRAAVGVGRFSRPLVTDELVRILRGRQRILLERYLTRISPLAAASVHGGELCLTDVAIESGLRDARRRRYSAHAQLGWPTRSHSRPRAHAEAGRACLSMPSEPASSDAPVYWVVDVVAETVGRERTAPARVHLYQLGPDDYRVVGLERPNP